MTPEQRNDVYQLIKIIAIGGAIVWGIKVYELLKFIANKP